MDIRVCGRVQGVLFRHSALGVAIRMGLKGFVRNEPDGSVYMEAEGDEGSLNELLKWCNRGPQFAEVTKIESEFSDNLRGFTEFTIE